MLSARNITERESEMPQGAARETWFPLFCILTLMLLGAWLRLSDIQTTWFSVDEGIYLVSANSEISDHLLQVRDQAHPQLYFLFLEMLHRLLQFQGYDFRWISFAFGMVTVLVFSRLGYLIGGRGIGVLATGIASLSTGLIIQSQIVRPYSLLTMLSSLIALFLVRYQQDRTLSYILLLFTTLLLGSFLHYLFIPLLFIIGTGIFLSEGKHLKSWMPRKVFIVFLGILVLFAFALIFDLRTASDRLYSWMKLARTGYLSLYFPTSIQEYIRLLFDMNVLLFNFPIGFLSAVVFFIGLFELYSEKQYLLGGICTAVLISFSILAFGGFYPFGGIRHSVPLFPFFCMPILFSMKAIWSRTGKKVLLFFAPIFLLLFLKAGVHMSLIAVTPDESWRVFRFHPLRYETQYSKSEFIGISQKISELSTTTDRIVFSPSAFYQLFAGLEQHISGGQSFSLSGIPFSVTPHNVTKLDSMQDMIAGNPALRGNEDTRVLVILGEWDTPGLTFQFVRSIAPTINAYIVVST